MAREWSSHRGLGYRSAALRHDESFDLASVFRLKEPSTPGRGMAANPKKHCIFSGLYQLRQNPSGNSATILIKQKRQPETLKVRPKP
jgi:hypothetical protein